MPSGSNSRSARNSGSGRPETRAISTPWMSEQVLYSHASPGWCIIITAAAMIGLVIEATRKIESLAIGQVPSTSAEPAASTSTRSPRAIRPTAPGTDPLPT